MSSPAAARIACSGSSGRALAAGLAWLRRLDTVCGVGREQVPADRLSQRGEQDRVDLLHRGLGHAAGAPAGVAVVDVDRVQAVEATSPS
jgi:hypothetical protein